MPTIAYTQSAFQKRGFWGKGRYWIFYSDGTNLVYITSRDGKNWTEPTTVRALNRDYHFSVYFDGAYVHLAIQNGDYGGIRYRRGLLKEDGTIEWQAESSDILTPNKLRTHPTICVDSEGYPWIACGGTSPAKPKIVKSARKDGIWETASGFPVDLDDREAAWMASVVPLSGGKVAVVYVKDRGEFYVKAWNGANWLSPVSFTVDTQEAPTCRFSAVGDDKEDVVHIAYRHYTNRSLISYRKYVYATNSITDELQLAQPAYGLPNEGALISLYPEKGNLYVFYKTDDTHLYYREYDKASGVWKDQVLAVEDTYGIATDMSQIYYIFIEHKNILSYMRLATSDICFVTFDFTPPPPPPPTIWEQMTALMNQMLNLMMAVMMISLLLSLMKAVKPKPEEKR